MTAAHFSAKIFTHHRDPEYAYMYTLTASLPHTHAKYVRVALYLSNGTYPYDTSANTSTDQYINAGHPHCDYNYAVDQVISARLPASCHRTEPV
jgi:hypothetical protein